MPEPPSSLDTPLVILSPHRDDAAFSASLLLFEAARSLRPATILNLFTRSNYAPFATEPLSLEAVTALRLAEDQAVLAELSPLVQIHDLCLLDAPLRLNIPDTAVLSNPLTPAELTRQSRDVASSIPPLQPSTLLVLPLSIGNHVDHRIGRDAGMHRLPATQLAFYQDLPYADRISSEDLDRETTYLLGEIEQKTGVPFRPYLVHSPVAKDCKHRLASCYASQVSPETVQEMSRWSGSHGGEFLFLSPASLAALQAMLPQLPLSPLSEMSS